MNRKVLAFVVFLLAFLSGCGSPTAADPTDEPAAEPTVELTDAPAIVTAVEPTDTPAAEPTDTPAAEPTVAIDLTNVDLRYIGDQAELRYTEFYGQPPVENQLEGFEIFDLSGFLEDRGNGQSCNYVVVEDLALVDFPEIETSLAVFSVDTGSIFTFGPEGIAPGNSELLMGLMVILRGGNDCDLGECNGGVLGYCPGEVDVVEVTTFNDATACETNLAEFGDGDLLQQLSGTTATSSGTVTITITDSGIVLTGSETIETVPDGIDPRITVPNTIVVHAPARGCNWVVLDSEWYVVFDYQP